MEAGSYVTYQIYNSMHPGQRFGQYDLLLDNQADISVIHPRLLCEIMQADMPITVNGIGGKQLVAMQPGYLDEFFHVYVSEQAKPNMLSLAEVEDIYEVMYIPGQAFIVHLPGHDLEFKCKGKLYIANYKDVIMPQGQQQVCATVQENESIYTRTEIC